MAKIGTFTKHDDGSFTGAVNTLTIQADIEFIPVERQSEASPDYRARADGFELGAAWKKRSKQGIAYLSVKIDDPSLAAPLYCRMLKGDGGYSLHWNR